MDAAVHVTAHFSQKPHAGSLQGAFVKIETKCNTVFFVFENSLEGFIDDLRQASECEKHKEKQENGGSFHSQGILKNLLRRNNVKDISENDAKWMPPRFSYSCGLSGGVV